MLVKKLVTLLPPGTSEETIKKSIQVLRAKNGKLSGNLICCASIFSEICSLHLQCKFYNHIMSTGWPTSKIAAAINELIQGGEV